MSRPSYLLKLWTNLDNLTDLDRKEGLRTRGHKRKQIFQTIRIRRECENGDFPSRHVLLVFDVLVVRQQDVPIALGERKEFAVLLAAKTNFPDRLAFMAERDQRILDGSGEALINQYSHLPKRARTSAFASSSAAIAFDRVTPGKCSKKTSRVSPPSK
ncbi:MAG TPA: hypothetical protein VGT24_01155 [Candidatus Acidoferrales bacterium]|nr:hypothetical protein [Candidatus Acidoferrales bacterium]